MVVALWVTWQTPASPAVPAKDFTLPSATDGSLVRLSDYAGKVVLINWWRTSCTWSPGESDRLAGLYSKYHAKGFEIIGISDDESNTVGRIPAYIKTHRVTWPIVLNDQAEIVRDLVGKRTETPQNFLVSRAGSLTSLGLDRSPETWRELEDRVAAAVAEPSTTASALRREPLRPAPPLSLPDLDGKLVDLSALAGHPVVVNFFSSRTCSWAGAALSALQRDYVPRGLKVIGVDVLARDLRLQNCVDKFAITYPILRGTDAAAKPWVGPRGDWATFFVTKDGKVLKEIQNSITKGLEAQVFPKYAEALLNSK